MIFEAPGNFGTKDKIVEFVVFGRKPELKNSWMEMIVSAPSNDHDALKNPEVSPSGPGALLGFSENISFVISSVVGIRRIAACCCCEHLTDVKL